MFLFDELLQFIILAEDFLRLFPVYVSRGCLVGGLADRLKRTISNTPLAVPGQTDPSTTNNKS